MTDNQQTLPKLLRAIAGGEYAKSNRHDVIFRSAATLIEEQRTALQACVDRLSRSDQFMDRHGGAIINARRLISGG